MKKKNTNSIHANNNIYNKNDNCSATALHTIRPTLQRNNNNNNDNNTNVKVSKILSRRVRRTYSGSGGVGGWFFFCSVCRCMCARTLHPYVYTPMYIYILVINLGFSRRTIQKGHAVMFRPFYCTIYIYTQWQQW